MKTKITSNGKQLDIVLTPENKIEEGIVESIDLFKNSTTVFKNDEKELNIHINTEVK
jgi:hypothetical protein